MDYENELCDLLNSTSINTINNNFDVNYTDLTVYNIDELSESINKYNLFYNTENNRIILLTSDVKNDITNSIFNTLNKCSILKTNDNVFIIYYPIKNNIDNNMLYNHLNIYQVGEVLYNLRLNNLSEYITNLSIINDFINYQIKINNIVTTMQYLNTYITINNINIHYGFILWLYFLMKLRQDYINYYKIIDFDEKIIDCDIICNIYQKLYININKINKEINKWFL